MSQYEKHKCSPLCDLGACRMATKVCASTTSAVSAAFRGAQQHYTILVLYSSASSPGEFSAIMSERWAAKAESESPRKQDEPSMAHRKTVAHSSRQWIEGSRTDKKDYAPWSSEEQQYIWPPDNTDSTREVERVSREEAVYVVHI